MFIDELKFYTRAGRGGDGVARWRHEPGREFAGPSGGNGGKGGDVFIEAVRDIHILAKYRHQKEFCAQNGEPGASDSRQGANGEDLVIKLPIGSVVKNLSTDEEFELLEEGQRHMILAGGRGGVGNEYFKSSTNRSPKEFTLGQISQEGDFTVELRLFADLGLIGLPNAGKSSLINELTNAGARVADYPFTTLNPNLGAFHGYIIADIPGLIENASDGRGLGHKFLRHIKRTKILVHLVSFESKDMMKAYKIIRKELKTYDEELVEKKEVIVLSKSDLADKDTIKNKIKEFKKVSKNVFAISIYDSESIKNLTDNLVKLLRKK